MDSILEQLVNKDDIMKLVHTWYKRDENSVPAEYVLQPISSGIPEYEKETGKALGNYVSNLAHTSF